MQTLIKLALSVMMILPTTNFVEDELKSVPETNVIVHDSGNIEIVTEDESWLQELKSNETLYKVSNENMNLEFSGDALENVDNKIYIPQAYIATNLTNGEYNLIISSKNYKQVSFSIIITKANGLVIIEEEKAEIEMPIDESKNIDAIQSVTSLEIPIDLKVEELDNGDIKVSTANQEYIDFIYALDFKNANLIGLFFNDEIIKQQGYILIPNHKIIDKVENGIWNLTIKAQGYTDAIINNVVVTQGKKSAPKLEVEELPNGDIKITTSNQNFIDSNLEILFHGENDWFTFFPEYQISKQQGYILIPSEYIKNVLSNGTYEIEIRASGFSAIRVSNVVITKGGQDAPPIFAEELANGDIKISSSDETYLDKTTHIILNVSGLVYEIYNKDAYFKQDDYLLIPNWYILKYIFNGNCNVQLTSAGYVNHKYANIDITKGLQKAPEVIAEELANGDIKISTTNQSWINSVESFSIYNDNDKMTYSGSFSIKQEGSILIPNSVFNKEFFSGHYNIEIRNIGFTKTIIENFYISQGKKEAPEIFVETLINGDIKITSTNQDFLDVASTIEFLGDFGKNFNLAGVEQYFSKYQGYLLIPHSQIKKHLINNNYDINVYANGYANAEYRDFEVTNGQIKAPAVTISELANGDIEIACFDQTFLDSINRITVNYQDIEKKNHSFVVNQGSIIIPYAILTECQQNDEIIRLSLNSDNEYSLLYVSIKYSRAWKKSPFINVETQNNGDIKISSDIEYINNVVKITLGDDENNLVLDKEQLLIDNGTLTITSDLIVNSSLTNGETSIKLISLGYKNHGNLECTITSNKKYIGDINSELLSFSLERNNNGDYLTGQVVVVEWVNGESTVPKTVPSFVLNSTDGTVNKELFMTPQGTNTYYFDGFINGLDMTKEYKVEIGSTNPNNIGTNKHMYLRTDTSPNVGEANKLGVADNHEVHYVTDNGELKVVFKEDNPIYVGDINSELLSFSLKKNEIGDYLTGEVVVVEWVNGVSTVPKTVPSFELKSTDGEITKPLFMTPTGTNTYYFDGFINGLDMSKEYKVEIGSTNPNNVGTNKHMFLRTDTSPKVGETDNLGIADNREVHYVTDNGELKVIFNDYDPNYIGDINSELLSFSLEKNEIGDYLTGKVVIVEWINGVSTVPTHLPTFVLKSTDGEITKPLFMTPTGTNTYYFDGFINGLDMSKEYVVEITSGNAHNMSENKSMYLRTDTSPLVDPEKHLGIIDGFNAKYYTDNGQLVVSFSK